MSPEPATNHPQRLVFNCPTLHTLHPTHHSSPHTPHPTFHTPHFTPSRSPSSSSERDWYLTAEQPAPAPHLAHLEGCAALRIVLITVPRVSRSCEHFLDGFDHPHYVYPHGGVQPVHQQSICLHAIDLICFKFESLICLNFVHVTFQIWRQRNPRPPPCDTVGRRCIGPGNLARKGSSLDPFPKFSGPPSREVSVGEDDGGHRPWQYIYVYSIESRLITSVTLTTHLPVVWAQVTSTSTLSMSPLVAGSIFL